MTPRHDIFGDEEETNKKYVFCVHTCRRYICGRYYSDNNVLGRNIKYTVPLIGNPKSTRIGKDALLMFYSIPGRTRPDPLTSR